MLQQNWAARLSGRGLAPMGPRSPCWPLPSLSSWQMKESKQSSLALSNAPGTLRPDPPTARPEGAEGRAAMPAGRGSQARFSSLGPRGSADSGQAARLPGRGLEWRWEGGVRPQWPRTSRSGNPLPHSLSLQLCRGLANGKRKLGQRKRRQAPRLKKTRTKGAGLPPPLPSLRGPGTASRVGAPCSGRPARPGPLPTFLLPTHLPRAALALAPFSALYQPMFPEAVPTVPAPCAPGCTRRAGIPRPRPCCHLRGSAWIRPLPWPSASPGGAGAPGGAGSRPGRKRLHSSGGSGGSAAWALLGARAGTREGRGRRGGARSFAPPPSLPTGRTRLSLGRQTGKEG